MRETRENIFFEKFILKKSNYHMEYIKENKIVKFIKKHIHHSSCSNRCSMFLFSLMILLPFNMFACIFLGITLSKHEIILNEDFFWGIVISVTVLFCIIFSFIHSICCDIIDHNLTLEEESQLNFFRDAELIQNEIRKNGINSEENYQLNFFRDSEFIQKGNTNEIIPPIKKES